MPKLSPVAILTAIMVVIGLSQMFIPVLVGFVGFDKDFNKILKVSFLRIRACRVYVFMCAHAALWCGLS